MLRGSYGHGRSATLFVGTLLLATTTVAMPHTFDHQMAAEREAGLISGGAWHYKSFRCADTVVTYVGYRLVDASNNMPMRDSGSVVVFASGIGYEGLHARSGASYHAAVTKYETDPIMAGERVGDRVQVCHIGTPVPSDRCNPDVDTRGREYRVYDYRQHAAYEGISTEHTCGGA